MKLLQGKRVLVTAGPTREPIDPVRYLSNRSSGKMGYAIAIAAKAYGACVTLISGPVDLKHPRGVRVVLVETAAEMRRATLKEWRRSHILFMVAAVSDFIPAIRSNRKIKKQSKGLNLHLKIGPDILAEIGRRKRAGQTVIGFAAETDHHKTNARRKLIRKKADAIFLNPVEQNGTGFSSDQNQGWLLRKEGRSIFFKKQSKNRLAHQIISTLFQVS